MQGYAEVYFCTTVASKVEVHMAYCEDATCAKCGTPFPNMYGYVDGECNRDFLKAACSATKALDGGTTAFVEGWLPEVLRNPATGAAVAAAVAAAPMAEGGLGVVPADAIYDGPDDGLTAAERLDFDLEEPEYTKPRAPMMPKDDADKFFASKYTEGPEYEGAGAHEPAAGAGHVVFANEGARDSARACRELVGARAQVQQLGGDADAAGGAAIQLALERCATLTEQTAVEQAAKQSRGTTAQVEVNAAGAAKSA